MSVFLKLYKDLHVHYEDHKGDVHNYPSWQAYCIGKVQDGIVLCRLGSVFLEVLKIEQVTV